MKRRTELAWGTTALKIIYQESRNWKLLNRYWKSMYETRDTVVVQSLSHVWPFETPWTAALQASLSFTISWTLLKLMSIESEMPSNHFILWHPLLVKVLLSYESLFNTSSFCGFCLQVTMIFPVEDRVKPDCVGSMERNLQGEWLGKLHIVNPQ